MDKLKAMLYTEPGPLGAFKEILDYIPPKERKRRFNENLQLIVEKAKGSSHFTNAIHMSVWSFFSMVKSLDWLDEDADVLSEALVNGQACKGDALIDQFKRILAYQGADPYITFGEFTAHFGTDIQVIASDLSAHLPRLLNSHTCPDLPVAVGVAMSSSFPIIFPAIEWKKEWGLYNGEDVTGHLLNDGGLISNFPIRYFMSNEPEILSLRGGRVLHASNTLFLGVDASAKPELSPEQRKMVDAIPVAEIPPCESHFRSWRNWANFQLASTVLSKLGAILNQTLDYAGLCKDHSLKPTPASWSSVIEALEDLPGPWVLVNMYLTLAKYEELLLMKQHREKVVTLPVKGLSDFSIHLTEENVAPFTRSAYDLVSKRLQTMFSPDT